MLTYGGFLLLGGRLGDLYGHRRLFLYGITLFTVTSLACGLAMTQSQGRDKGGAALLLTCGCSLTSRTDDG